MRRQYGEAIALPMLRAILQSIESDAPIHQILVGVHWTAVMTRHCGLALTKCEPLPHHDNQVRDVGRLHQKSALALEQYVFSERLLEANLSMAAINSLIIFKTAKTQKRKGHQIHSLKPLCETLRS